MNFITKPLSNTNVYSDKLQIVKSKKKKENAYFHNPPGNKQVLISRWGGGWK